MKIVWIFIGNRMILVIHNNCIFPYYGYSTEIVYMHAWWSKMANFISPSGLDQVLK
jgi:hypothetical protein